MHGYSLNLQQSPLCDEGMIPLLNCIMKTIDPNLHSLATTALISGYKDPETLFKALNGVDEYLCLIVLFSTFAGFEAEMTKKICDELYPSRKDTRVMAPINEFMGALYKSSFSLVVKERLLGLIFQPPVKGVRESKPSFNDRLNQYRQSRQMWIAAAHSLLYFGQEEILKNVTNTTELVNDWKTFMGKTFYLEGDALDQFLPIFVNSKRCPNGFITYAARLQTLPQAERDQLMPLIGKFASAVLNKTLPQVRYSFAANPHLNAIFSENEELLTKWQTSLPIKIGSQENMIEKTSLEQVQKLMRDSLENHHLGTDQDYPELEAILDGTFEGPIENDILRNCAEVLSPKTSEPELKLALMQLQKLFPNDDAQFYHDLKGMVANLETPQSSVPFTIEDTDAWEDFLLMGTEVDNSCQHIQGDPAYNKCLLASFLDGKIRLMVAREKGSGKILGRVVLRVLLDANNKPVLFVETLYTRKGVNAQLIRQSILEGCRQKAQSMGIPLAASARDYSDLNAKKYPGVLKSLGGPAPYEYVDALRGIQGGGFYTIPESYLLWSPSTESSTTESSSTVASSTETSHCTIF